MAAATMAAKVGIVLSLSAERNTGRVGAVKSAKNASTVDTTCAATQGMPGELTILAIGLG